ncbi:acyltransferase family protein [Undibacterium sp.]|uniref:acyltransferase family protein n=1 Tax=Undibacterium sp. TaxID=1914977 RepID=UPI00374D3870
MKVSGFTSGKNNNFNLIRMAAALAVLFGHSFALLLLPEPLGQSLGMSIGSISVDIFFITSGFLVTGSLLAKQSIADYVLARVLRIYPALAVVLLLSVLVLGPSFTTLSVDAYFHHTQTYSYFLRCIAMNREIAYYLPGVFDANPYKGAVNGSLWTMVYEIRMYLLLAAAWCACSLFRTRRILLFKLLIAVGALWSGVLVLLQHASAQDADPFPRLFFMFACGAVFWVLKDYIRLSATWMAAVSAALLISALTHHQIFFVVYLFSIAYALFYLAYIPGGKIRRFNDAGDYSYGVYIYAFPVQQMIIALLPQVSPATLTMIAAPMTLGLAALSWHVVEQPALKLKGMLARRNAVAAAATSPLGSQQP